MDWWKKSVIYQIYPKSFKDSNGDGIGDIQGIISKLDYLENLGIDAIWLSPVYKSPQDDNGYDISDYQDIDPMFGSLDDINQLIRAAATHNIRIIMDLVLNHSSDEHPWFKEAKTSKDSKYHDYYIWIDGVEGELPNELNSAFGGTAWEYVPELGQYYLHIFSTKQPDLNWENPMLRKDLYEIINWWTDKGIGGYRLDVIDHIGKDPLNLVTANGPNLHKYIRELSEETLKGRNLISVGECWGADIDGAKIYSDPSGNEFSMVFQFEHIMLDQMSGGEKWDLKELDFIQLKKVLSKWQIGLDGKGWNSLFWNNHDLPRIVSRWGNDREYRVVSAKMLATVLHGMQGTPYIYQGEELGMTNIKLSIEDCQDIESLNMYQERIDKGYSHDDIMASIHAKGRDNARTPMQWSNEPNGGFSIESARPWMKINPNYIDINAESELLDDNSVFHYYRRLIQLRKECDILTEGHFEILHEDDPDLFIYRRVWNGEALTVIANFYGSTRSIPSDVNIEGDILIHKYENFDGKVLRPYEALMIM